ATVQGRSALLNALTAQPSLTALLQGQRGNPLKVAFSPDSAYVVNSTEDGSISAWDTRSHLPVAPGEFKTTVGSAAVSFAFSGDDSILATAVPLELWDFKTGKLLPVQPETTNG